MKEHSVPQMQPLSIHQTADLNNAICISAVGTVTSIKPKKASFVMHLTQYVTGGEIPHQVAVCAEVAKNVKWHNPSK